MTGLPVTYIAESYTVETLLSFEYILVSERDSTMTWSNIQMDSNMTWSTILVAILVIVIALLWYLWSWWKDDLLPENYTPKRGYNHFLPPPDFKHKVTVYKYMYKHVVLIHGHLQDRVHSILLTLFTSFSISSNIRVIQVIFKRNLITSSLLCFISLRQILMRN